MCVCPRVLLCDRVFACRAVLVGERVLAMNLFARVHVWEMASCQIVSALVCVYKEYIIKRNLFVFENLFFISKLLISGCNLHTQIDALVLFFTHTHMDSSCDWTQ